MIPIPGLENLSEPKKPRPSFLELREFVYGRALEINPETYFADVLMRVQSHQASGLAALLPQNWSRRE